LDGNDAEPTSSESNRDDDDDDDDDDGDDDDDDDGIFDRIGDNLEEAGDNVKDAFTGDDDDDESAGMALRVPRIFGSGSAAMVGMIVAVVAGGTILL
jgi:hypothetical protein